MRGAGMKLSPIARARAAVLIRTEGSAAIGMGHILRTSNLAKSLKSRGVACEFILDPSKSDAAAKATLKRQGFKNVHFLKHARTDSRETVQLLKAANAKSLIVDKPEITTGYVNAVRRYFPECIIAVIDDGNAEKGVVPDIRVSPNLNSRPRMDYPKSARVSQLIGPEFLIMHPEIARLHDKNKTILRKAKKLLVTVGGSDVSELTPRILKALEGIGGDFEITVVIGPAFPKRVVSFVKSFAKSNKNVRVFRNVKNMPDLIFETDLAITAGGLTKYECVALGTPSVVISQAGNQIPVVKPLHRSGALLNISPGKLASEVSDLQIRNGIAKLFFSYALRKKMSRIGKRLNIDGMGVERIAKVVMEPVRKTALFTFRPAKPSDCKAVWEWRNDPDTRRNSFSTCQISYAEHKAWFTKCLNDRNVRILVFESGRNRIGQVRFNINPDINGVAEIHVTVAPAFRGKGYGSAILSSAGRYALSNLGLRTILAKIKKTNVPSIRAFRSAGFRHFRHEGENVVLVLRANKAC